MAVLVERKVPDIDGDPTYIDVTFKWIDAVGDTRSDVLRVDFKATHTQIEELVNRIYNPAYALLWEVRVAYVYGAKKLKSNAGQGAGHQVQKAFVYHVRNAQHESRRSYLPSPRFNFFLPDSEIPDANHTQLINWMTAVDTVLGGTYAPVSLRFTQRRDIGKKKDL